MKLAAGIRGVCVALLVGAELWAGLAAVGQVPGGSVVTVAADVATVPVHTVVHLTASVQSLASHPVSGTVTFMDGPISLGTLGLTGDGIAVLGTASLPWGTHKISAVYSGDGLNDGSSSAAVEVSIVGLGAPFTLADGAGSIYVNEPVSFVASGLPPAATGAVTLVEVAGTLASMTIGGVLQPGYDAFGDETTVGGLVTTEQRYPSLFAADYGFVLNDVAMQDAMACDVLPLQILANGVGPTQVSEPLSSVMVGSRDLDEYGVGYLAVFHTCEQATLAWLGVPREYKVLPGDAGARVASGVWASDTGGYGAHHGTLFNGSGAGTAEFDVTSNDGPIYLWYLMEDGVAGMFSVSLDGIPMGAAVSTQSTPAMGSLVQSAGVGFGLLRLAVGAGPHVVDVTVVSGSVGVLGVGTPASAGSASVHPTVLVSDIPNQLVGNPVASAADLAAYTQDIAASVTLLAGDGLDVRLVPTEQFMLGQAAEMNDSVHPNALGQSHLESAFVCVFGSAASAAPYATFTGTAPTASVTFTVPGTHTIQGNYVGDASYAATTSPPLTITVLPQSGTTTELATQTTHYFYGTPVTLTATVAPASATGMVTFFDGTSFLGQAQVSSGVASLSNSSLGIGLHSLTAGYSGDVADAASGSPPLEVEIHPVVSVVSVGPLPVNAAYGSVGTLSATVSPMTAGGTVTFMDSVGGNLGQVAVVGGAASIQTAGLTVGSHVLTAMYSGDANDLAATSAPVSLTIVARASVTTLSAGPATLSIGGGVVLVATVTPAGATGMVMFRDGGVSMGTVALVNGVATLSTQALRAGLHELTAVYGGDAVNTGSSSGEVAVTVLLDATTTVLMPLPLTIPAGSAVTLRAVVTPSTAGGLVVFRDAVRGVLGEATVNQGGASLTLTAMPAGSYSIAAAYLGDAENSSSSSVPVVTAVVLNPTLTTLAPLTGSVPYTTPLTLAATVNAGAASGLMQFFDGANLVGQAAVAGGTATLQIASLATGVHALRAVYGGDSVYAASSSSVGSLTVTADPTVTTLAMALVAVPAGSPVIFNVKVTSLPEALPGGMVTIRAGGAVLASGPLGNIAGGNGYATLSVNSGALGLGSFAAVAFYSGDANDVASDSMGAPAMFRVVATPTTTLLTLSAAQVPVEGSAGLTISVTSVNSLVPTGSVTFFEGGSAFATVPLNQSGVASATATAAALGSFGFSATFNPTGLFASSSSPAQTLVVTLPLALLLSPLTIDLTPGSTGTANLTITPLSGFQGAEQVGCQTSASFLSCSVAVPSVVTGTTTVPVQLAVARGNGAVSGSPYRAMVLLLFLVPLAGRRRGRRELAMVLASALVCLSGCGEGGNFGTIPVGPQTATVTVVAAGAMMSVNLTVNIHD